MATYTRFSVLEEAASDPRGEFAELAPARADVIDLCESLCTEGLLEQVEHRYYDWTYRITDKGRAFVKEHSIPAEW